MSCSQNLRNSNRMKRQTITLTITYEDAADDREPPSAWDWQTLLGLALQGHAPASVKVGAYGPAKTVGDDPEEAG